MPLTLFELRRVVIHTLGHEPEPVFGSPASSLATQNALVNQAGRWMYDMHPWNWRSRASVDVALTAGQDYVDLPANYGEYVSLTMNDGVNFRVNWRTVNTIDELRSGFTVGLHSYFVAPIFTGSPSPTVRLAVWPTPTVTTADAFRLNYRSKWAELTAGSQQALVPTGFESLLIQCVRAVANEFDLNEDQTVITREGVYAGQLFRRLAAADARLAPILGPPMRTARSSITGSRGALWFDTIGGPS